MENKYFYLVLAFLVLCMIFIGAWFLGSIEETVIETGEEPQRYNIDTIESIETQNWTIVGDVIYLNDDRVFISAEPHTLTQDSYVYFNVTSKIYEGPVDVVLGINSNDITLGKPEYYNPHNVTSSYTCPTDYFNYTLSPKRFWCYELTNTSDLVLLQTGSFEWGNLAGKTVFWNTTRDYSKLPNIWTINNHEYQGMNKWYTIQGFNVQADKSYYLKVPVRINRQGFNPKKVDTKYWFGIKPSTLTISQAIDNDKFYMLDPWINSSGVNQSLDHLNLSLISYYNMDGTKDDTFGEINGSGGALHNTSFGVVNTSFHTSSAIGHIINLTNAESYKFRNNSFAWNFWIYQDNVNSDRRIFGNYDVDDKGGILYPRAADSNQLTWYQGNGGGIMIDSNYVLPVGSWQMVTIIRGANTSLWINGTLFGSASNVDFGDAADNSIMAGGSSEGTNKQSFANLDEIGIWNRSLNSTEVAELYNNGLGVQFVLAVASPFDPFSFNFTENSQTFPTEVVGNSNNTYNINLTFANNTFSDITVNFTINNTWHEGVETRVGNESRWEASVIAPTIFNPANFSFFWEIRLYNGSDWFFYNSSVQTNHTITPVMVGNIFFENTTTEGNDETFSINFTYDNLTFSNTAANLIYNNTLYTGASAGSGSLLNFTRTITVPVLSANTNISFVWEARVNDGSTWYNFNTSVYKQEVNAISMDDCTGESRLILNYTLREEESQDFMNGSDYNTSIQLDVEIFIPGTDTLIVDYSQNYSQINPAQVCVNESFGNTTVYRLDAVARYEAPSFAQEIHNIQNATLSNETIPQNINLFDLKGNDSTRFLITFKDENFLPIGDALIDITRKYISEGAFKSIEIPKTDDRGQAVGHFDLEAVIYSIIVSKNGVVLATFDNIAVVCQDIIIEDCRLELNELITGTTFTDLDTLGGITYSINFDEPTRTVTTTFTSTDGSVVDVTLNSSKYDRFGNETVCLDTLSSSSGTLSCVIPESFGNVTVIATLSSGTRVLTARPYTIAASAEDVFGDDMYVMVVLMIITIPLMLIGSAITFVIGIFLGLIMGAALLFLRTGIIGTTSVLVWVFLTGGIIIWKLSKME